MLETQDFYTSDSLDNGRYGSIVTPFFSMRQLRLVYNELKGNTEFEYDDFDAFKHNVLSSTVPQLELSKWQTIAARR
ncbi:hypothetical protein [Glaciecola sp. 1036]|uniref:hypothetical protein n=1 Tax=Alteromonadaceae TaxID=72275 RepID=UPI003CFBC6B4